MRIGILFCAYNCADIVLSSINAWVKASVTNLDGHEFIISAVSIPFKEYQDMEVVSDNTTEILHDLVELSEIDYLVTGPKFISEAEARNLALEPLLTENLDYVILWDGDEIASLEQISAILKFIRLDPWTTWYRLSYKNYVFDEKTFLTDPFTPPRIFKVKSGDFRLSKFSWDNDVAYINQMDPKNIPIAYNFLPSKTVPKSVAWIPHFTWLSNEKTRLKVIYQMRHFHGNCSYKWNDERNYLEFNYDYYLNHNIPVPSLDRERD